MKPIKGRELQGTIAAAYVQYSGNPDRLQLTANKNSCCHFFEPFMVDGDEVRLRLDWSDIDTNGYPTLDADFFNPETGRKRALRGARLSAHHTSTDNPASRTYTWVFKNVERSFRVTVHWLTDVSERVSMGDEVSAEIKRR
jgi:hypothetical protein